MPLDFSTRAQIAVLIHRILQLDISQKMVISVEWLDTDILCVQR